MIKPEFTISVPGPRSSHRTPTAFWSVWQPINWSRTKAWTRASSISSRAVSATKVTWSSMRPPRPLSRWSAPRQRSWHLPSVFSSSCAAHQSPHSATRPSKRWTRFRSRTRPPSRHAIWTLKLWSLTRTVASPLWPLLPY